jgi:UDP-N-acetylglucosamine 4-epimerase
MSSTDSIAKKIIGSHQHRWLITGVAGFIGSNLLENLLLAGQKVRGFDNFATGKQINLDKVKDIVGDKYWSNFEFIQGDLRDLDQCISVINNIDYVLHQAALGSVPKSIEDPITWNAVNVSGTLNMMTAAKQQKSIKGFVYASSSSVYGDSPDLPKVESSVGAPLSPYAASKYSNELYARSFASCYKFNSVGLRYFNVFGPRQDPEGAYAAVIPKWLDDMKNGVPCGINGDGTTSRDFCYIQNVVQANILGALNASKLEGAHAFNVGVGENTNLLQLHQLLAEQVSKLTGKTVHQPVFRDFRTGDVKHSLASIDEIVRELNYSPTHTIRQGIELTVPYYL